MKPWHLATVTFDLTTSLSSTSIETRYSTENIPSPDTNAWGPIALPLVLAGLSHVTFLHSALDTSLEHLSLLFLHLVGVYDFSFVIPLMFWLSIARWTFTQIIVKCSKNMLQNIFWGSASITSPKWKRALPLGAIIRSTSILSRLFYRSIFIEVVTPLQDHFLVRLLENVPMSPIIDEKFSRGQSPLTPSPSSNKGPDL